MINNVHLPELNKIFPYAARLLGPMPSQQHKKKKLPRPVYVCMGERDIISLLNGFLFPWKTLRNNQTKLLARYVTSRIDPVHQYHCFQFIKLYTPLIIQTIGPRDMLRLLDLVALCVYKYATCFPSLRQFAAGKWSEWNKDHKYQHYLKSDKGDLFPKTRVNTRTGLPKKPPLQITNPEFRIKALNIDAYDELIATVIFRIRLTEGYWLQEILTYLGDVHQFDIFKLVNVRKEMKVQDIVAVIDTRRNLSQGIPCNQSEGDYYDVMSDSWSDDSQKTTKLEYRLKTEIAREKELKRLDLEEKIDNDTNQHLSGSESSISNGYISQAEDISLNSSSVKSVNYMDTLVNSLKTNEKTNSSNSDTSVYNEDTENENNSSNSKNSSVLDNDNDDTDDNYLDEYFDRLPVCLLCYEKISESATYLPKCNHTFHMTWIDILVQQTNTCPACQSEFTLDEVNHQANLMKTTDPEIIDNIQHNADKDIDEEVITHMTETDKQILSELKEYNLEKPMKMISCYHPISSGELSIRQMYELIHHFCDHRFNEEGNKLHVMNIEANTYFESINMVIEQFRREATKDQTIYYEKKEKSVFNEAEYHRDNNTYFDSKSERSNSVDHPTNQVNAQDELRDQKWFDGFLH